jgi:hypothetical protein
VNYVINYSKGLQKELEVCRARLAGLLALEKDIKRLKKNFYDGGIQDKVAYLVSAKRYSDIRIDD